MPLMARTDQECKAVRVGRGPGLTDTQRTSCAIIVQSLPLPQAWPRVVNILTLPSRIATYNYSSHGLYGSLYSVFGSEVHARIQLLLSLRYGVSPGAKELGEVMW